MLKILSSIKRVALRAMRVVAPLAVAGLASAAMAAPTTADLQVSTYTWLPNPVANGAEATFTIRIDNNGGSSVADAKITVAVPSKFTIPQGDVPAGCTLSGAAGSQSLVCTVASLEPGRFDLAFKARATSAGSSSASVAVSAPNNTDPNPVNNSLSVSPSVEGGSDLKISQASDRANSAIPAGGIVTYTLKAFNAGPDATSAVRIIDNLPAASDFAFVSASGTDWNCTRAGTTVTCLYTGAALNGVYPDVNVKGRILATGGTVTNNAFTEIVAGQGVQDPDPDNNSAQPIIVSIEPGADFAAEKSMPASIVQGDAFDIVIGMTNTGPTTITGATVVDAIAAEFEIGTLPIGCTLIGRTVSCVAGALAKDAKEEFRIPVTAMTPTADTAVNTAVVSLPAGYTDPTTANDTKNVSYKIVAPTADLSLAKTKGPNPVAAGGIMTSTITLSNAGPAVINYDAANPLRIIDTVSADETFAAANAPWACSQNGLSITCDLEGTGTLAVGSKIVLSLQTIAANTADIELANTACTVANPVTDQFPGDENAANNCADAKTRATVKTSDLEIVKQVSLNPAGPWTQVPAIVLADNESDFYIRLVARNLEGGTARTVVVTDNLPNYINSDAMVTAVSSVSSTKGNMAYNTTNGRITWSLTDLDAGDEEELIVKVIRPFESGTFTNTATISSVDTVDENPANNQSTADYNIEAVTDITINDKSIMPNPARVGVLSTYTISVRNLGPNPASDVVVTDDIDLTRFELVGAPTPTKPGANCSFNASGMMTCNMGTMTRGQTFQISQQVRPRFPFGGAISGFPISHTNTANVTTSTLELDTTNNSNSVTHSVNAPEMDLVITKSEPPGDYDPVPYGSELLYDIRVTNLGPSRASNIVITDTPAPPVGFTMTMVGAPVINPVSADTGFTLQDAPNATCVPTGGNVVCRLNGADPAQNFLNNRSQVILRLRFAVAPANASVLPPTGSMSFDNSVSVVATEQDNTTTVQYDPTLSNNTGNQTTTVVPSTDLELVSKTRITQAPIQINQPVEYRVVVRNKGPSPTTQIRISDQLPTGWTRVGGETFAVEGATNVTAMNCAGTNKVTCTLDGLFPIEPSDLVSVTFFAKASTPFAGALNTDLTNTAQVQPGLDGAVEISRDTNRANNTATALTRVTEASIAGRVYRDDNLNNVVDSGEAIPGVTLTLTGTDVFGTAISSRTVTTDANGNYVFGRLSAGTYTITQTQPSGTYDRNETAGTAGGDVDNSTFSSGAVHNRISNINLTADTAATGYIFQEIGAAKVSGYIYRDLNNNGIREGGELGFAPSDFASSPHVRLTGTDYAGNAVNLTATVNSTGLYQFTNVSPSGAAAYTVTQLVQPNGASDGKDANGLNTVLANSSGRAAPEGFEIGLVASSADLTERNFGELPTSSLGGMVFLDPNANAVRDANETAGLAGAIVRLTGTNDLGAMIDCSVTVTASGLYQFPVAGDASPLCQVLRPGQYQLDITPAAGLTHTGVYIGAMGGSANGVTGPNAASLGAAAVRVSGITVPAGTTASNYDFGATGQGLGGFVYIDRDASGVREAGEAGIPGVTMTLSGLTATGQDICTLIACDVQTDATGAFIYLAVPGSDAAGYTLTQQAQNTGTLSNFADGADYAGNLGGIVNNDVISGIMLPTGAMGINYSFGELASQLSGSAYIDANDDGIRQPAEVGLAGVTVTLSGVTNSGQDICAWRAALNPSQSCVVTTDASGNYVFEDMPKGTYALVQTQPGDYADGREHAGSAGGTVNSTTFDSTAAANTISNIALGANVVATDYGFGERAVVIKGNVFKDIGRDGNRDDSDTPIAGVTITLADGNGTTIATTTTDANGDYSFSNLASGDYTITQTQPLGYGSSTPNAVTVNLTPGVEQVINFGETVSSMAGHVFVDTNNDGTRQTGEAPIAGVVVTLSGTDDAGNPVTRTVTTDAQGEWVIQDLLSGTYQLVETQPEGYSDGLAMAGSVGGSVDAEGNRINGITLPVGTDATDYAFGERGQSLNGTVYVDVDGNGSFGPQDRPLAAVVVELRTPNGELVATATSNTDGSYSFGDVRGGDYVVVQIQPEGYGDGRENAGNRVPVTIVHDQAPPVVNFGERTGSLSGLVYNDANGDGIRDANEPVIAGVIMTLTGTDSRGEALTRTAVTNADGSYTFADVQGGIYSITQTQPAGYEDGIDTPGSAGGIADGADTIAQIVLPPATDATGYLFGESGEDAAISGTVWLDTSHNRTLMGAEELLADWKVELLLGDVLMDSTQTGFTGEYSFVRVPAGTGYSVRFRHPHNNVVYGGARPNETGVNFVEGTISSENPGGASIRDGELAEITLLPGATLSQQSLPLDPWGVVYDSVRRTPVQGAIVEITGPAGFDAAQHLLGGTTSQRQVVDAKGLYFFQLNSSAPAGNYALSVTPPNGIYNPIQPSSMLPPCAAPLVVGATPNPMLVSTINGAPAHGTPDTCMTGTPTTGYVLSVSLTPGLSANVVNNNIPLDPILEGAIEVTKTTPMVNVVRGGLVPYVVTARNTLAGTVPGVTVTDRAPAGFRYREGSALVNGVAVEPQQNGRLLSWPDLTFAAGETKRFELILVVGAGVIDGEHTNTAFAINPTVDQIISNIAEATVRMIPDPDFDCTDILGKVFDDRNGNGVQDDGEPGLPGVRLATARGLLITTDAEGRYHITCPMIPNEERGSNFIVKLDDRTLPTGYRVTSGNPETVRLTRGKFARLNFGASLHRVVRVDLNADAFDGTDLRAEFEQQFETLLTTLAESPSVLRLAYATRGEDADLVRDRIATVRRMIRTRWNDAADRYRLVVEEETVIAPTTNDGGAQ